MTAVLIETSGVKKALASGDDPEELLREHDARGQVVNLHITDDEGNDFSVWMCIDPAQPVNSTARHVVSQLSAVHIMCFGPVLLEDLDDDLATELIGG